MSLPKSYGESRPDGCHNCKYSWLPAFGLVEHLTCRVDWIKQRSRNEGDGIKPHGICDEHEKGKGNGQPPNDDPKKSSLNFVRNDFAETVEKELKKGGE